MLVVDIGNSRCKLARITEGEFELLCAQVYPKDSLEAGARSVAALIFDHQQGQQPVRLVCVLGGEFLSLLLEYLKQQGILDVQALATGASDKIRIAYERPAELGLDRLAAMLGALAQSAEDAVVVDAGTAITIDAVRADGEHLGGLIMPGRKAIFSIFSGATPQLPMVQSSALHYLATGTQDAMYSGTTLLLQHGLDRTITQILQQLPKARIWVCGGDAGWLSELLSMPVQVEEWLVLKGVYEAFGK